MICEGCFICVSVCMCVCVCRECVCVCEVCVWRKGVMGPVLFEQCARCGGGGVGLWWSLLDYCVVLLHPCVGMWVCTSAARVREGAFCGVQMLVHSKHVCRVL